MNPIEVVFSDVFCFIMARLRFADFMSLRRTCTFGAAQPLEFCPGYIIHKVKWGSHCILRLDLYGNGVITADGGIDPCRESPGHAVRTTNYSFNQDEETFDSLSSRVQIFGYDRFLLVNRCLPVRYHPRVEYLLRMMGIDTIRCQVYDPQIVFEKRQVYSTHGDETVLYDAISMINLSTVLYTNCRYSKIRITPTRVTCGKVELIAGVAPIGEHQYMLGWRFLRSTSSMEDINRVNSVLAAALIEIVL